MSNLAKEIEEDINDFLEQARLIHECQYFQNLRETSFNLKWDMEQGMQITSAPTVGREIIEPFIMKIRPLIVKKERLYVGKIISYLINQTSNQHEIDWLKKLLIVLGKHENKRLFAIKVNDKEYGMPDFVWLYLYGKYFHIDRKKKQTIKELEQVFGTLTENTALNHLEGYAGIIFYVAGYINKTYKNQ